MFLSHRSAALWTQRPWWWGCWISPLMCWCSDTECRNASIARSASSYSYFTKKNLGLSFLLFFSCVIWPIRNILAGLLRPVLFSAVLNHLNFWIFEKKFQSVEGLSTFHHRKVGKKSELTLLWLPEDLEQPSVEQVTTTHTHTHLNILLSCFFFYDHGIIPKYFIVVA